MNQTELRRPAGRQLRQPAGRQVWAALALLLPLALAAGDAAAAGASLQGVVNVNTASMEELQLLPGVGPSRAHAIVAARRTRGGFQSVDELVEVKGIGQATLDRLRPFVTVKGETTASIQ